MSTLVKQIDKYYTLPQLRAMHQEWLDSMFPGFTDLLEGELKDETLERIIKYVAKDSFELVSSLVGGLLTAYDFMDKFTSTLAQNKIVSAIKLLESVNVNGAVRFRTNVWDVGGSKPYRIDDFVVTYNSNF